MVAVTLIIMPLLAVVATAFSEVCSRDVQGERKWNDSRSSYTSVGLKMVYRFSEKGQLLERASARQQMMQYYEVDGFMMNVSAPSCSRRPAHHHHHDMLHRRDRRRLLAAAADGILSFASGNLTMNYGEDYGWLHYAIINIGTPNISFLVALDTGSDLLWVPCECRHCASNSASSQQLDLPLNVYNPAASKTNQHVTCTNSLCGSSEMCESKSNDCLYNVRYVSANTWTSGVLVEDVIYLSSGKDHRSSLKTRIVFGCGQVQSGNFLSSGAPDGLLGLGFGAIALPNALARSGLVKDSFSMCFESDGSGRIFFGDKGSASQKTTPFLPITGTHNRYVVGLESITVGLHNIQQQQIDIIVDSGTSFTYLPKDVYSAVTAEFDKQIAKRRVIIADVPWDFCYETSSSDIQAPLVSMVFNGGGNFSVYDPLIGIDGGNGSMEAFCLAILESDTAILGQSFMTGYQLVFDREEMKLGWSSADCYKLNEVDADAATPSASSGAPPPVVVGGDNAPSSSAQDVVPPHHAFMSPAPRHSNFAAAATAAAIPSYLLQTSWAFFFVSIIIIIDLMNG